MTKQCMEEVCFVMHVEPEVSQLQFLLAMQTECTTSFAMLTDYPEMTALLGMFSHVFVRNT